MPRRALLVGYIALVLVMGGALDAAYSDAKPPEPNAPTGIAAECTAPAQVIIGWNYSGPHDGYSVERRESAAAGFNVINEQESCACAAYDGMNYYDFGAAPGATYLYRVRTFNERGQVKSYSPYSDTIIVTTPAE